MLEFINTSIAVGGVRNKQPMLTCPDQPEMEKSSLATQDFPLVSPVVFLVPLVSIGSVKQVCHLVLVLHHQSPLIIGDVY